MKINISTIKSLLYIAVCVLTLYACKKTEDAPPLPENRMLQFTVTNTSDGAIQGVINDKDSTLPYIFLTIPACYRYYHR
jgi:hypothetical protein